MTMYVTKMSSQFQTIYEADISYISRTGADPLRTGQNVVERYCQKGIEHLRAMTPWKVIDDDDESRWSLVKLIRKI